MSLYASGAMGQEAQSDDEKVIVSGIASTQPSKAHAYYEPIIGAWETNWKLLDQDGVVRREVKGTATNEWIIGGRWVQQSFVSEIEMGGEKFNGIGMFGHDNTTGEYHNVWFESNRTAVQYDIGTYDAKTKTFTFVGDQPGADGSRFTTRTTMRIDSADRHTIELFVVRAEDDVAKVLEMVLTRAKADDDAEPAGDTEASPKDAAVDERDKAASGHL